MRKKIPKATIRRVQALARKNYAPQVIAEATGISVTAVCFYTSPRYKKFESLVAYHEHLAELKGYASRTAYQKEADEERSQRKKYQEVSRLVRAILRSHKENQSWLARYLGLSRQAVTFYAQGKRMPAEEIYQKLRGLQKQIPSSSLEEKVEE